ncbi:hypothetical protein FA13DRAFT_606390 [Coprinellus micaceus]|uniref:DUF6534 domain-containing protein n=1 Tax=Coprinellus micaceus TaxID=71717 RepID=A0A4Y7T741_COPMI|nr:hypothetical protein FA13DRAFT_606390 [Coprinellus micaceus]
MNRDTDVLLGPILIGSLLAYLLMGAYLVQLYHYLAEDPIPGPRIRLHIIVALVTAAEATNVVFISQTAWRILIQSTQRPEYIVVLPVGASGTYTLNAITPLVVQCFFAWRIMRITRRKRYVRFRYIIPAAILALLQTGALLVVNVEFIQFGRRALFLGRLEIKLPLSLYLAAALACDTLITAAMIFILLDFKAATELSTTKRLLNMLIFNAVENGAVTTVCAALNLAFYLTRPLDYIHLCFSYAITGLYVNVLLASLNGRGRRAEASTSQSTNLREIEFRGEVTFQHLGDGSASTRSNRQSLSDPTEARGEKGDGVRRVQSPSVAFFVSTVTEVHRDGDFSPRARAYAEDRGARDDAGALAGDRRTRGDEGGEGVLASDGDGDGLEAFGKWPP